LKSTRGFAKNARKGRPSPPIIHFARYAWEREAGSQFKNAGKRPQEKAEQSDTQSPNMLDKYLKI
jgi:hypothetical protein